MDESSRTKPEVVPEAEPAYEAPLVETVVTPADLEREVHYAGQSISQVKKG